MLILDNVSIYKSTKLCFLYKEKNILLKFLLLYSPDFNPIKNTFKDLKAWIKKNYRLVANFKGFGNFLKFAIS